MKWVWLAAKLLGVGVLILVSACSGYDSVETGGVSTTIADKFEQDAPLGTTFELNFPSNVDGAPSKIFGRLPVVGTAAFTVANLQREDRKSRRDSRNLTYYSVDVAVNCYMRTVLVNPYFFMVRTRDGSNIIPNMSISNEGLPLRILTPGRGISGKVYFGVANDATVEGIVLSAGLSGPGLARWTVLNG